MPSGIAKVPENHGVFRRWIQELNLHHGPLGTVLEPTALRWSSRTPAKRVY
jgi:hypothetical protein